MRLFFWKKQNKKPVSVEPKSANQKEPSFKEEVNIGAENIDEKEERNISGKKYSVLAIKKWCDEKLRPLAWTRVLLNTFPSLVEHGYDFDEIENPKPSTTIGEDYYKIIQAEIREIQKQDFKNNSPK